MTRTALFSGLSPFCKRLSWVVIPVGHVFLLHFRACIHPNANMKPRAEFTKSAPAQKAQATSAGVINFPVAIILIRSVSYTHLTLPTIYSV